MHRSVLLSFSSFQTTTFVVTLCTAALDHNNYLNSVELNRESELYLVFEAEFVPDQLEFFPAIVLAFEWSHIDLLCLTYCSTIWDLLVNHLRIGTCHFRSISFSAQLSGIFW